MAVVNAACEGDLTYQVTVSGQDDIGQLGEGLQRFLKTLCHSIANVSENAMTLAGSSEEMSADPATMFGSVGRDWRKTAGPGRPQAGSNPRRPAASGSAERLSRKSLSRPPEGSTRRHAKGPVEEPG